MLVEVRKGADSPKPPQERGLQGRSHAAESGAYQKNTIQHVMSDEGLGGTSIEEHHASVRRNRVPSAIYCKFGSKRNVV